MVSFPVPSASDSDGACFTALSFSAFSLSADSSEAFFPASISAFSFSAFAFSAAAFFAFSFSALSFSAFSFSAFSFSTFSFSAFSFSAFSDSFLASCCSSSSFAAFISFHDDSHTSNCRSVRVPGSPRRFPSRSFSSPLARISFRRSSELRASVATKYPLCNWGTDSKRFPWIASRRSNSAICFTLAASMQRLPKSSRPWSARLPSCWIASATLDTPAQCWGFRQAVLFSVQVFRRLRTADLHSFERTLKAVRRASTPFSCSNVLLVGPDAFSMSSVKTAVTAITPLSGLGPSENCVSAVGAALLRDIPTSIDKGSLLRHDWIRTQMSRDSVTDSALCMERSARQSASNGKAVPMPASSEAVCNRRTAALTYSTECTATDTAKRRPTHGTSPWVRAISNRAGSAKNASSSSSTRGARTSKFCRMGTPESIVPMTSAPFCLTTSNLLLESRVSSSSACKEADSTEMLVGWYDINATTTCTSASLKGDSGDGSAIACAIISCSSGKQARRTSALWTALLNRDSTRFMPPSSTISCRTFWAFDIHRVISTSTHATWKSTKVITFSITSKRPTTVSCSTTCGASARAMLWMMVQQATRIGSLGWSLTNALISPLTRLTTPCWAKF
mmetsp:Transcript_54879/g.97704  ORF Transcript_54879/g.97704 Transcript_54879/m.97704 type:complete len:621 (-) Transcript_54879:1072-2934(-)